MKKILVFGAYGSIGLYLVEYLRDHLNPQEYQIVAAGRRDTSFFSKYNIDYFQVDVQNRIDFNKLPSNDVYAVIHLANMLPSKMDTYDPYLYLNVNTIGTLNVLEYMRRVKAKRILFTQTYADLGGHWGKELVLRNSLPRKMNYRGDHAVYAISKCAAVDLMEHYHQEFGIENYVFRLPNIYMYSPKKYYYVDGRKTLISYRYMIEQAIKGEPIELWGNPDLGRDIVYIKDLCQMMYLALLCKRDTGTYNVGTGKMTTMREQIEGIIEVFSPDGKKSRIIPRPEKRNSMSYVMDISEAREELGYIPKYDYISYLNDYKKEMLSKRWEGIVI